MIETYQEWKKRKEGGIQRAASSNTSGQRAPAPKGVVETYQDWKKRTQGDSQYPSVRSSYGDYDRYINNAATYFQTAEDDFNAMNFGNRVGVYETKSRRGQELKAEGLRLINWLEKSGDDIDAVSREEMLEKLRVMDAGYDEIGASFADKYNIFNNFETEDDYLKWNAYSSVENRQDRYEQNQTRLEELKKQRLEMTGLMSWGTVRQDTSDIDAEIAAIEREMQMYERGGTDADTGFYYGSKVVDDYSAYLNDPNYGQFSAEDFRNPTKDDLRYYDAMMDQSTWYQDGSGNTRNRLGDIVTESVYADDPRYQIADPLGAYLQATPEDLANMHGDGSTQLGVLNQLLMDGYYGSWDQLDESEREIYYTLLGTQGKEAAMKYLSDMETELNRRNMAQESELYKLAFERANGWQRLGMSAVSIPANLLGGATAFVDDLSHTVHGEDINPYSAAHQMQNYGQQVRANQAAAFDESSSWEIPGIGFSAGDLYQAAMSTADMFGGEMIGPTAYGALMGMGAASSEARRLYEMGASREQIFWGSAAAGAAEMVFEKIGLDKLLGIKNVDTLRKAVLAALISGGVVEAGEEGGTELANLITNHLIMTSESDWTKLVEENNGDKWAAAMAAAGQIGEEAAGGFVSGLIGGTFSATKNYAQNYRNDMDQGKAIQEGDGLQSLRDLSMAMAEKENGKAQAALRKQSDRLGKEFVYDFTRDRAAGRLYRTVQNTVSEANKADVAKALQEQGYTQRQAKNIADAFYAQAIGMEVSKAQQKVIQEFGKNEDVQKIIGDMLLSSESTIAKRNQDLQNFRLDVIKNQLVKKLEESTGEKIDLEEMDNDEEIGYSAPSLAVSEDGSTRIISTGKVVNITGFANSKDGKAMLRTDTGEVVAADDVSYANDSDALIYETIANLGAPVSNANGLLSAYKGKSADDAEIFARGIQEAFEYGRMGIPMAEMKDSAFASQLSEFQMEYAYKRGTEKADVQNLRRRYSVKSAVKEANAVATKAQREHRVVLEDDISVEEMTTSQKVTYDYLNKIVKGIKGEIHVYSAKTGEMGYYDKPNDRIYLNINATNKSEKALMVFVLGHELVHRAKVGSPEKYEAFKDFLLEQYGKRGASVNDMIQQQLNAAKENNIKMTREEALEEVVCDACQRMLLDTNAGKRLAAFGAQSEQNRTFLDEIRRIVHEFMEKMRAIFSGVNADSSLAAEEFNKFDTQVKRILADMYVDMTMEAGKNLDTIMNAYGNNTLVELTQDGEVALAQNADGSQKVFNLVTWENGGRETLVATLKREGYTQDDIDAALTIMDANYNLVKKIANEVDGNGKLAFPEQGRINEATLTTDIKDGHSVLSALVSNGDYPVNIDLLMVCKKRKAYQRVINRLCETGMIKQATVDALAIAEINKILGKYGFETACLGCFVESRRLRIQEWAETIVKEWNSEVKKRNPNAKPFGFGKGDGKLGPDEIMKLIGELESGGEKNDKGNLNLGVGSAVKRMGVLLDKVPTLRRTLTVDDLITPEGLSRLRRFDSNLFSMVKSRYGSNSPKFVQEFNPYNHELARYGKVPTQYNNIREYLYAIGGARMQSFSDFIVENWFDYTQIVADLAARKLPMHTYTKEIAMVKLFGMTGIKINMSLIPDVDKTLGKEYAGLTRNADGKLELIWADKDRNKATGGKSYMQSINAREAFALQNDPRYSSNIGTIAIGVSDMQIRMMLNDSRIRMVIPYHSSGMNPIYADMMGTSFYKDYTNVQNTTIKQIYNSKGQPVSLKLSKPQIAQLTGGFLFNDVLQNLGDARAAAEAYKEWCADSSKHTITIKGETYTAELTPKFNDFAKEPNYYKLLEDFNTYDCITEQAAPQGDVQQIYPEGFEKILRAELKDQETHRKTQAENKAFDKAMADIESYLKSHTKADTVYYAQQAGIKLSKKDSKLDAADKERLKRLQEQGASFMLPKSDSSSYQEPAYHEWDVQSALYDAMDHADKGYENMIRVGEMPRYITDMIGIEGDFYIYRNHAYENMVSREQAINDGRPVTRKGENIHFHDLGLDIMTEAIMSLENPTLTIATKTADGNPAVIMLLPVHGKNKAPLYAVLSFYSNRHINGDLSRRPHIVLTIAERDFFGSKGRSGYAEIVGTAIKDGRVIDFNKKMRDDLSVIANPAGVGNITDSSLKDNLSRFRKEIKSFREKNHINYKLPIGEDTSIRTLLANAFDSVITNPVEKQKLQEYRQNIEKMNEQEAKLRELKAQIKELSFAKGPRDKAKIAALQEEARKTENRINTYDGILLRFEASKPLQQIVDREKAKVYSKERAKVKKAREEQRETAAKRHEVAKLMKLVMDTSEWVSGKEKSGVKVPDALKVPYAEFLKAIELPSSKQMSEGGDPTQRDLRIAKAMTKLVNTIERVKNSQDPSKEGKDSFDMDYLDLPADFVQKFRDLTDTVTELMTSTNYAVNGLNVGSRYVVDTMSASEVKQLSKLLETFNHAINEAGKLYNKGRFANAAELGKESMGFMDALGEIEKTSGVAEFVEWDNALPFYAFKRFGDGGQAVFEGFMDAQDKLAFLAKDIFDFQEKTWKPEEVKKWSEDVHTITTSAGSKLTLTTADAMTIYCLSRRQQGKQHLLGGGVRVVGIKKGSTKAKDTRSVLTQEDLDAIETSLTDRQKKVAEDLQRFMSTTCAKWGNEISMKRFLTREFTEENYFPIESNDENMTTKDPSAQQSDLFRLLNISATKALDPDANNEVIIRNVFDVFIGHATDMAKLNAYAMPLLDYMKWLNYRERTETEEGQVIVKGVRKSMETAYGNAAKSYVLNLIKDINGRVSDGGDPSILMQWMRNAKTANVGASGRIALLQITSYPRAALVLSPKSLALGLRKLPRIEKAKKYCGIALWKSFGFYDTNIARSIEDQLKGTTNYRQKLIELSLKGAEWADAITWGALWNACEYEVAASKKYEVGTETFNRAVADKLREVVYRTQVVDSILTRTQIMRRKSGWAQEFSSYMSEPTLSANILMDAAFEFNMEKRRTGNAKAAWQKTGAYVGRALAVYSVGQLVSALFEGFSDAWRDDDDEEFWSKKFPDAFKKNLVLDLMPFNKIPIVSDVFEAVLAMLGKGYFSSDSLPTTGLMQAVKATDAWRKALDDNNSTTVYNATYNTVKALSTMSGVSFSGAMREIVDVWNITAGSVDTTLKIRQYRLTKDELGNELFKAITSGDTKQANSLENQFEDEAAVHTALRKALRSNDPRIREAAEYLNSDDYSSYLDIVEEIMDEGHFDRDDVIKAIRSEASALAPEEGSGVSKAQSLMTAEQFAIAVANGDNDVAKIAMDDIIATAQENGKTESEAVDSFHSSAKNALKDQYLVDTLSGTDAEKALVAFCGMDTDEAAAVVRKWEFESKSGFAYGDMRQEFLAGNITAAEAEKYLQTYGGKTADEAAETIKEWEFEKKNGYVYSDRKNAFLEGKVSASALRRHMMEYDGMSAAEADNTIRAYEWMKRHPQYDMSVDDVIAYTKPIEKLGYSIESYSIKPEVFIRYKDLARNATGVDSDGDGKADTGSKKAEILEIINALPLTAKQKDALYYLNGWAASNLRKAPWH